MKQLIDFKSIWYNTKRALYATMIIALVLAIPVLSWIELSNVEKQDEKTIEVAKNNTTVKPNTVVFQKQS